jgi:hypothetical protein
MTVIVGQYPTHTGPSTADALIAVLAGMGSTSARTDRLIRALSSVAPIATARPLVEKWDKAARDYEASMVFAARAAAILPAPSFDR